MESDDCSEWLKAIEEELNLIDGLGTFELAELPPGRKAILSKWVFRIKHDAPGTITRYKDRLIACGYTQIPGVDFFKTYAPVAHIESFHILLALAAHFDWEIVQLDVKNAFLNGKLDEEIYMKPPKGFSLPEKEHLYWRLLRTLYCLKQSSYIWYLRLLTGMLKLGYQPLLSDACIFMRISPNRKNISIIRVHMDEDDMGLFCNSVEEREHAKAELKKEFPINDLGEPELLLGLKITHNCEKQTITISQTHYIDSLLKKFGMMDANPASTPLAYSTTLSKQMSSKTQEEIDAMKDVPYQVVVGSLMYTAICTCPDISHAVGLVSQFSMCYEPQHWTAVKHILRYLKGTRDYCLTFGGSSLQPALTTFSDADYAQNPDH